MVTYKDLQTLFPLSLGEDKCTAHIKRSYLDYAGLDLGDEVQELEIIGSKAIYYLAPLLYVQMQNRVAEYEESLQTFKDIERFQEYWLERSLSAANKLKNEEKGSLKWAAL